MLPNSAPDSLTPKNLNFVRLGQKVPEAVAVVEEVVVVGTLVVVVAFVVEDDEDDVDVEAPGWPKACSLFRTSI